MRGGLCALLFFVPALGCAKSQPTVERIEIHAEEVAMGELTQADCVIQRREDGYLDGQRRIEPSFVANLLRAALAPAEPELRPERLRPLIEPLRADAHTLSELSPRAAHHFEQLIADPRNVSELIRRVYTAGRWTDDDPSLHVQITRGGAAPPLSISTNAQQALVLPWRVTERDSSFNTWNPDISQALENLLPPDFLNREWLSPQAFAGEVIGEASNLYREELAHETAEERLGVSLDPLRKRFHIEKSSIGFVLSFNANGEEKTWSAKLSSAATPQVKFEVYLTLKAPPFSTDALLRDADELQARLTRLPWLERYLKAHPDSDLLIQYYNDRSLSPHARDDLLSDLRRAGRQEFATWLGGQLERSMGFFLRPPHGYGLWILLPDSRSMFVSGDPLGAPVPQMAEGGLMHADGTLEPP